MSWNTAVNLSIKHIQFVSISIHTPASSLLPPVYHSKCKHNNTNTEALTATKRKLRAHLNVEI